jgi:hypothetical protein
MLGQMLPKGRNRPKSPNAAAAMNAVLTGNFTPCLREWLCEIAFVTKKSITWPFFYEG